VSNTASSGGGSARPAPGEIGSRQSGRLGRLIAQGQTERPVSVLLRSESIEAGSTPEIDEPSPMAIPEDGGFLFFLVDLGRC
jgi:hypothetical protein